jgi:TRAP-type C4-dicarboxylate transport system substrate-binding protein
MTISWAEIPTSLQTGIVDAWAGGNLMYHYGYTGDIIKYSYVGNSHQDATSIVMNLDLWNSLSPEDQQIFMDVISEATIECAARAPAAEEEFADKLRERGVQVIYATDEEMAKMAAFKREIMWPQYEDMISTEFLDGVIEDLKTIKKKKKDHLQINACSCYTLSIRNADTLKRLGFKNE